MIVFHVSGEQEELATEEIRALYEAHGEEFRIVDSRDRLLLVKRDLDAPILSRLAFTHAFFAVNNVTDIKNLDRVLLGLDLKKAESFCVRCLGFPNNAAEERRAGEVAYEARHIRVDLKTPKVTLYLIKIGDRVVLSLDRHELLGFADRDPNDRPFFHPLALNPRLARLFLNLARLKEGDRVLDPFCGSGSVLIEAGLMGLKPIGIDKDLEMLWGCKKNLGFYGITADVRGGDATEIGLKGLDAIVTDPPYARSSKVYADGLSELYEGFLKSSGRALKPGGYVVFSIPSDADIGRPIDEAGFILEGGYGLYSHRSLTRRIYILRKPN